MDTPVGRGRPPTLRRSLLEARGRSPGWRSRKRLGTLERAPLDLKSSIMTSSPPLAGMLSLVLRRSAGRVRGSLCYGRSRSSLLLSCLRLARATGAALLRGDRLPCLPRQAGSSHTGFLCAPAAPTAVCACPVTPLFSSRDVQGLRPRAGAAPRRGTGSLAAPRRRGCVCLFLSSPLPPCAISPFLPSETSSRARIRPLDGCSARVRRPQTRPARNCSSYVDGSLRGVIRDLRIVSDLFHTLRGRHESFGSARSLEDEQCSHSAQVLK